MTLEVGFFAKNPGCERRVMESELRSYLKQPSSIDSINLTSSSSRKCKKKHCFKRDVFDVSSL